MTPSSDAPDAKDRLLAEMRAAPSPTRRSVRRQTWLVLPAGAIGALALYFAFQGTRHGEGRPGWFYAASALSWAAIAALSIFGAAGSARGASWRPGGALVAVIVGTPALLFAVMFAMGVVSPEVTLRTARTIGWHCLEMTLAAAVFPLLALLRIRRGSDPVHPGLTGAALGTACGAAAGVMVELWCPVAQPAHIAFGHILPIAVLAVLGGALGSQALAVRGPRRP